ncbi:MAG: glutaredoxin family protein [Gemmataceae bacterium]
MTWWPFPWRRRPTPRRILNIVLYTRRGCHLCEDAETLLKRKDPRLFHLQKIDVDSDPALVKQFGNCVPVMVIDGKVRFRGRVEPALLERFFLANSTS